MPVDLNQTEKEANPFLDQYEQGIKVFSVLITRWMDTNGWSHAVMTNLAKCSLEGAGWIHSSQISGLRYARLRAPGPRTFVALERLNYHLHQYSTTKKLIPGTSSSNFYSDPYVITEDGAPPPLGWWVEVFCGFRVPKDIDIFQRSFTEDQAENMSENFGRLMRTLLIRSGIDIIDELERVIHHHYPTSDAPRVAQVLAVIRKQASWSEEELLIELPALVKLTREFGGPKTEDELVDALS